MILGFLRYFHDKEAEFKYPLRRSEFPVSSARRRGFTKVRRRIHDQKDEKSKLIIIEEACSVLTIMSNCQFSNYTISFSLSVLNGKSLFFLENSVFSLVKKTFKSDCLTNKVVFQHFLYVIFPSIQLLQFKTVVSPIARKLVVSNVTLRHLLFSLRFHRSISFSAKLLSRSVFHTARAWPQEYE